MSPSFLAGVFVRTGPGLGILSNALSNSSDAFKAWSTSFFPVLNKLKTNFSHKIFEINQNFVSSLLKFSLNESIKFEKIAPPHGGPKN